MLKVPINSMKTDSCKHGYYIYSIREDVNPYTGEVEEIAETEWFSTMKYHTTKSDKCTKCGYIFNGY